MPNIPELKIGDTTYDLHDKRVDGLKSANVMNRKLLGISGAEIEDDFIQGSYDEHGILATPPSSLRIGKLIGYHTEGTTIRGNCNGQYLSIQIFASCPNGSTAVTLLSAFGWLGGNTTLNYILPYSGWVALGVATGSSYGSSSTIVPSDYAMDLSIVPPITKDVSKAKEDTSHNLQALSGEPIVSPYIYEWIDGEYIKTDGTVGISKTYHRTDYIKVDPNNGGIIFTNNGGNYDVIYNAWYDENKDFISSFATQKNGTKFIIPPSNARYMRLSFNRSTTNTISQLFPSINDKWSWLVNNGVTLELAQWANSIYYWGEGVWGYSNTRLGMQKPLVATRKFKISGSTGYKYAVFRFSSTTPSMATEMSNTGWIIGDHIVNKGEIILINMAKSNDSAITPSDSANLVFTIINNSESSINYVVGSDLQKKAVSVSQLGTLTYDQAFCKYNGKYYSINGSNIAEQDEAFAVLRNTTLSAGHGNGLQLGNSKYAYASGWDDNKLYKIDLENLVVDSIITLPTIGYTTGVVDEGKNIAYVFQRDSVPDHEDNYNFIVYDITNQQIVSTKKILAYGAMQACDLFNDRIIVLNGLGNSACPNGYRVFDTNGNILADYYLGVFDTQEPEGVCLDRDNHELLMSFGSKAVFKIGQ